MWFLNKKTSSIFWVFTLSLVFGLTLPVLIQHAMFQDAMLYSSVSHNLSIGFGTFWFPQYSTLNIEGIPSFHEQPPLVFGIQALFFKMLGDSIYVERIYTFVMLLLHLFLINQLWKTIFRNDKKYKDYGWLPILFFIIIPICHWSFRNNMLENTLSIFTLSSIIISYRQVVSGKINFFKWFLSGVFIFLASFSKGVPGFFPLIFPFIYWIITKKISLKQMLIFTGILSATPLLIYFVILLFPEGRESLSIYFFQRLLGRVHTMPTTLYRLDIAWRVFTELIPVLVISIIIILIKKNIVKSNFIFIKTDFLLFLAIGLSGSLPLMLTSVQKGFYLVPSMPYFSIAFAIVIVPGIFALVSKINVYSKKFKIVRTLSIVVFASVIIFTGFQKNQISRHEDMLNDVNKIGNLVPQFSTLTVPPELYNQYDFVFQGFLVRYYNISISPYEEYTYFIKEKKSMSAIPEKYHRTDLDLSLFELYIKN